MYNRLYLIIILITLIGALIASADTNPIVVDAENYVFVKVDGLSAFPYYWDGGRYVPAPVVYFVRFVNASWAEIWHGGKPLEVAAPVAEGPYVAVPLAALGKPGPPRGIPVDTPRGRAWLYFSKSPSQEGLPPYGLVLYLNATADPPGRYRGRDVVVVGLRTETVGGPRFAAPISAFDTYLFALETYPVTVGGWWSAVSPKNATGIGQSGYALSAASKAYLGYRVRYVYLAVAGPGAYSARLDIYASDTPSTNPPYVATIGPSTAYSTDVGAVFAFDVSSYGGKYLWATPYIYSYSAPQTVRAALSADYSRPSAGDPNWGSLVFEWRSVFADGYSSTLYTGVERLLFTVEIPQGSSAPRLHIDKIRVVNCAGASQIVRIYVGGRQVYQQTVQASSYGTCGVFEIAGVDVPAPAALDYARFNTSYVPIMLEFDPQLAGYAGTSPVVEIQGGYLYGYRWPQIWRESAVNFIKNRKILNTLVIDIPYVLGNVYYFNLWNKYSTKINESSAGLLGKFIVETSSPVAGGITGGTVERIAVSVQYVGFKYGTISPWWRYVCVARNGFSEQAIYVSGPGSQQGWGFWTSVVHGSYWIANTILTFIQTIKNVPSWVGLVLWSAGELVSKIFPSQSSCTIGSYTGLYYDSGFSSSIVAAHYNTTLVGQPTSRLSASTADFAVYVYVVRDISSQQDYGYYTVYGKLKALAIGYDAVGGWFDGPFEPYENDGGIMVRIGPWP
ncbi:MAG: hypothetical protein ACP5HD_02875 [Thermoproteus sp.]